MLALLVSARFSEDYRAMTTKASGFSKKAAVIAGLALALLGVLAAAVWAYPPLLLYAMLVATALVAYVAVYFLVLSQLRSGPKTADATPDAAAPRELVKQDRNS